MSKLTNYAENYWAVQNSARMARALSEMLDDYSADPNKDKADDIARQLRVMNEQLGFGIHPLLVEEKQ